MEPRRSLTAILFTDIVDSTRRAAELGDREWRKLQGEHHARVRKELRRFGGREANIAGDGFMAVFDRPATAIRGAAAIRASMSADLGREEDFRRGVRLIRKAADERAAENDSLAARSLGATAGALEGYATWRRGNTAGAWPMLESAQKRVGGNPQNAWIRWWLSGLATELGRPEDAIRYLESISYPLGTAALYPLARAYEEVGRRDDARRTYELLLTAWSEADPEQAPRVAEIRQRLAGLGMAPRG